jgi:hypothetical protein
MVHRGSLLERRASHRHHGTADPGRSPDNATAAAFDEVVCADRDLLRLEFDAIIAANFPPGKAERSRRPPRRHGPLLRLGRLRPGATGSAITAASRPARVSRTARGPRRPRQRGPPGGERGEGPRENLEGVRPGSDDQAGSSDGSIVRRASRRSCPTRTWGCPGASGTPLDQGPSPATPTGGPARACCCRDRPGGTST